MGPSIWQLAIVLVIVVVLFGTKRLRNLGGDLGSAIRGFKNAVKDERAEKIEPSASDSSAEREAEPSEQQKDRD